MLSFFAINRRPASMLTRPCLFAGFLIIFSGFAYAAGGHSHDHDHDHSNCVEGDFWQQMDAEFSVLGNFLGEFSDNKDNANRSRVRVREAEIAFGANLLPNLRFNVVGALEQEYEDGHVNNETHLEEFYGTFYDLPFDMEGSIGRKFVGFGVLNPLHFHERPFADTPLVLANLFGEHGWYDDGASLTIPVGDVFGADVRNSFGYYRGRNFGLEHSHEHEHGHDEHEEDEHEEEGQGPIEWGGYVYQNRISFEYELSESSCLDMGYSVAFDEGGDNNVHGIDVTYRCTDLETIEAFIWQNEFFYADVDTSSTEPFGFYSLLQFVLDEKIELGGRYDWSEAPGDVDNYEWAIGSFITYNFSESMYARAQYRYHEMIEDHKAENTLFLQFVWRIGEHSH